MKKMDVINLIKYFSENNEVAFRDEAEKIAKDFDNSGDSEIAEYIMSLLSNKNVFVPQMEDSNLPLFEKLDSSSDKLFLPDAVMADLLGIINAITNRRGLNKFLFEGKPGTGKTEAVKHMARVLKRNLFSVNFSNIVDSKLGSTTKNISELFKEINSFKKPNDLIILFDEIDTIALSRVNLQDHREMGRATSELLHEFDRLSSDIVIIATTNLLPMFDKALLRRFDAIISFDRYSNEDLSLIGERFFNLYLNEFGITSRDIRLFRKIFAKKKDDLSPGEIKNMIKSAIAFSDSQVEGDCFHRLYECFCGKITDDLCILRDEGFTVREISLLTGKSKSTVDRELKLYE